MSRREEWRKVLDSEVRLWSAKPCEQLVSELRDVQVYEVQLESVSRIVYQGLAVGHDCHTGNIGATSASLAKSSSTIAWPAAHVGLIRIDDGRRAVREFSARGAFGPDLDLIRRWRVGLDRHFA